MNGFNRQLMTDAARHLDTVAERLYESTLMTAIHRRGTINHFMEQRATLMRIAKELRELLDQ
jgi:hypothetical protein